MQSLVRTRAGQFALADSITLEQVEKLQNEGILEEKILAVDTVFSEKESIIVTEEAMSLLKNGNPLKKQHLAKVPEILTDAMQVRAYDNSGVFQAIYEYSKKERRFRPVKMFLS